MNLKKKLVEVFLGNAIESRVRERLKAASILDPRTVDEIQWRRLTTNAARDLMPTTQDRMIDIAYWLWETNPLAGWLIDITSSFILAEGLPYEAKDAQVKELLDGFWNDPVNKMDLFLPKHVSELHIFGELCMPAFVAQHTGRLRLGYIDPAQIECVLTDPENVKFQIGVLTKRYVGDMGGIHVEADPKKYKIILPEEAEYLLSPTGRQLRNQMTDGDCFFFSINNVTNSPRGRSSLLSVADWLDVYEQFLFDYGDRWPLLNSFVWDITVTGGDENAIKEQLANFQKKAGSIYGHNEKITLDAKAPTLQAVEAETGARIFRNHIMGRFGYPEHWYGGGGDVNRATAAEMDLPAMKMVSNKQNYVKYLLESILGYQIFTAQQAGYLRNKDAAFSVVTPFMQTKDLSKYGATIQQVAISLQVAEQNEWLDKDTARKLFATIMAFIGVDIDLEEVKKAIQNQDQTAGYQDYLQKSADKAKAAKVLRMK
jgi:hypothetical protein